MLHTGRLHRRPWGCVWNGLGRQRMHRGADLVDTCNAAATSRASIPSANIAAACRRTCSRRARACGPTPPPSLYRMPYEDTRRECDGITQTGDVDIRGTSIMEGQ